MTQPTKQLTLDVVQENNIEATQLNMFTEAVLNYAHVTLKDHVAKFRISPSKYKDKYDLYVGLYTNKGLHPRQKVFVQYTRNDDLRKMLHALNLTKYVCDNLVDITQPHKAKLVVDVVRLIYNIQNQFTWDRYFINRNMRISGVTYSDLSDTEKRIYDLTIMPKDFIMFTHSVRKYQKGNITHSRILEDRALYNKIVHTAYDILRNVIDLNEIK